MYIRRRNCDDNRPKKTSRNWKTFETFKSASETYLKLLFIWAINHVLNVFTDFHFEFFFSCWPFVATVISPFRHQGMAFALLFTLIDLTSDLVYCFLIPTAQIYFSGNSFVRVHLVRQANLGIYGPAMIFCFLIAYVEVAFRLRD